jgi:hypothetical protein
VFVCPFCFSVLGAGIDPIAAKIDIVTELTAEIQQVKDDVKRLATRHLKKRTSLRRSADAPLRGHQRFLPAVPWLNKLLRASRGKGACP